MVFLYSYQSMAYIQAYPNELIVLFVFDIQEEFVEYRNSSLVERVNQ